MATDIGGASTESRDRRTGAEELPAALRSASVALVHDYLNQRGGAERVALELSAIWPEAPIYTSLYRPESTFPDFSERDVRATILDRIPVDRGFRGMLPLYPAAFRGLGVIDADIVLSSSSGWAHLVRTSSRALHAVYCHTPARWLYRNEHLAADRRSSMKYAVARPLLGHLRRGDQRGASRADLYIANSENVRRRIIMAYGKDAAVIPPPVDLDRFHPRARGERLLVISRLLPYKRVDLVVDAATRLGLGLDVVGDGPMLPALRALAGPSVAFHGAAPDATLVELIEGCRAVCVAAEEDFGIVAVEAQAAGKPVIAYGSGGSLETVEEGVSGVYFRRPEVDQVIAAIRAADRLETAPEAIAAQARRFSVGAFRARLVALLSRELEGRAPAAGPTRRPRRGAAAADDLAA